MSSRQEEGADCQGCAREERGTQQEQELAYTATSSGSSPHKDIQGYPKISIDIHRYPYIRISFGYLLDIYLGYSWISYGYLWISLDILMDTVKISQASPLISRLYPELSIYLSRNIHLPIQRCPSAYPEISIYLSRAIHLPIQSYPYTYP